MKWRNFAAVDEINIYAIFFVFPFVKTNLKRECPQITLEIAIKGCEFDVYKRDFRQDLAHVTTHVYYFKTWGNICVSEYLFVF